MTGVQTCALPICSFDICKYVKIFKAINIILISKKVVIIKYITLFLMYEFKSVLSNIRINIFPTKKETVNLNNSKIPILTSIILVCLELSRLEKMRDRIE